VSFEVEFSTGKRHKGTMELKYSPEFKQWTLLDHKITEKERQGQY
jgi:hypothetical protein